MADVTSPFGFPYPEDTDLVRDGAQDIENLATGVNDYLTGGYLYAGTIYYTSSGNFVKADPFGTGDIGLRAIRVRMVGGGGGGGGAGITGSAEGSGGGGGGGGGYAETFITDIAGLDSSVVVTRGAGGGVSAGAAGSNGGTSSGFGLSATGGFGGVFVGATTVTILFGDIAGGLGSGGLLNAEGGHGGRMTYNPLVTNQSGAGGSSAFGFAPGGATTNTQGASAISPGCGGAGSMNGQNQAAALAGGAGANGLVIVDCFV